MVTLPNRQRLILPLAPLFAGVLAAGVAVFFAFAPQDILGNLVLDSGIATLVPAAEPPLGLTARAALVMTGGGAIGLVSWFALYLLIGARSIDLSLGGTAGLYAVPVLRRADAHPDAPARRPLFANEDLGTPFLDVRAPVHFVGIGEPVEDVETPVAPIERDLPLDLDTPLSSVDPHAIPVQPVDWSPAPPRTPAQPRPQIFEPAERFETFELTPVVREPAVIAAPTPPRRTEYDPSASIHALLDRLEKGVTGYKPAAAAPPSKAPAPKREETLQSSLASLRRMATSQ